MICKKEWDDSGIRYLFGDEVADKCLEDMKDRLVNRERALLPVTQILAEHKKKTTEYKDNIKYLHDLVEEYRGQITKCHDEIQRDIKLLKRVETHQGTRRYVMPCSSFTSADDSGTAVQCKGFVEDISWACGLCHTRYCSKCFKLLDAHTTPQLGVSTTQPVSTTHRCKKDDVATAKMIMKETKACPSCAARVTKINGCDQMFCIKCHRAFNWTTLRIIDGPIHNPEYFDLVNRGIIIEGARTAGDVPCGGLPSLSEFNTMYQHASKDVRILIPIIWRECMEIVEYLTECERNMRRPNDLLVDIRVNYLIGTIPTDEEFREQIFKQEEYGKKCMSEKFILTEYITCCAERFRDIIESFDEIMTRRTSTRRKHTGAVGVVGRLYPLSKRTKKFKDYFHGVMLELVELKNLFNEWLAEENLEIFPVYPCFVDFKKDPIYWISNVLSSEYSHGERIGATELRSELEISIDDLKSGHDRFEIYKLVLETAAESRMDRIFFRQESNIYRSDDIVSFYLNRYDSDSDSEQEE